MFTGLYVLEVVKFNTEIDSFDGLENERYIHIGYMNIKFKTKKEACAYYDKYNPHMRKINFYGTYESDWDPNNKLLYIVREDYNINGTIVPFKINT